MTYLDVNDTQKNVNSQQQQQPQHGTTPKVAVSEPAPLVQQAAQQSYAMNNVFTDGNKVMGKFENPNVVKPPLQNAGEEKQVVKNVDAVSGDANKGNLAPVTEKPAEAPSWENMPKQQPIGWNADGSAQYASLSDALNARMSNDDGSEQPTQPSKADFHADREKKDGGFFKWVKGLLPRKGKREGETDDEYDRRQTRNMQKVALLADAIRHIGNIVNTSKGAPAQKFNDATTMLEQGYQQRKAERAKKAAADAEADYKRANLSLKEMAAKADMSYKEFAKQMGLAKFGYQQEKDKKDYDRKVKNDAQRQDNWVRNFGEKKRHNEASEAISRSKKSGSGKSSGSTAKYVTYDAEGKPHYASNKTMYEANEARYNGNTSDNTTHSESKENITSAGTTKTTDTKKGLSVAQKAGLQQRARDEAKKKAKAAAGKGKGSGKGGWASGFKL